MSDFSRLAVILLFSIFLLPMGSATLINAATAPVTLFAPGLPTPEKSVKNKKTQDAIPSEGTDILIALVQPHEYSGREMDRPQLLGMYYTAPFQENLKSEPEWRDLLSDMEEIRYLDQKAWTANIATEKPGLYKLVLETRPWWDERRNIFIQHQTKLLIPVLGIDDGWNVPAGQPLEIVPLTNPFGLTAPSYFAAKILINGKPAPDMQIVMGRLNTAKEDVSTRWQEAFEAYSDANGQFGFVLNKPGWWFCEARIPGDPLKGPDGEIHELLRSALLWVHVTNSSKAASRSNNKKQ